MNKVIAIIPYLDRTAYTIVLYYIALYICFEYVIIRTRYSVIRQILEYNILCDAIG